MRITYTDRLLRIRSIYRNIIEDSLNTGNLYIIKGEKWAKNGRKSERKAPSKARLVGRSYEDDD